MRAEPLLLSCIVLGNILCSVGAVPPSLSRLLSREWLVPFLMNQASTESPLVSVIAIFYQCAPYVRRCVESILNQQEVRLELIAVDDCSTDGTAEMLAEFAARDMRVKLIRHQVNQGIAASRNDGLAEAQGDCFYFVDGDDSLEPHALKTLLPHFLAGADMVQGSYRYVTESDEELGVASYQECLCSSEHEIKERFASLDWGLCHNRLLRASLKHVRFRPLRLCEDLMWMMDIYPELHTIRVLSEPLYRYTVRENSASSDLRKVDFWIEGYEVAIRESLKRDVCWFECMRRLSLRFMLPKLYKNPVSARQRSRFVRMAVSCGILPAPQTRGCGLIVRCMNALARYPEWVRGLTAWCLLVFKRILKPLRR